MGFEKRVRSGTVYYVDNDNKLYFTKTEMEKGRKRYQKRLSQKLVNQ